MRTAHLSRIATGDQGTTGDLTTDSGFACKTIEPPWRYNLPGKSCILWGLYTCSWRFSPKHGFCYHVEPVVGRSDIEIHSANFAGDVDKGFKSELLGCIAPGMEIGTLEVVPGVLQLAALRSKDALAALIEDLQQEPFQLSIGWAPGVEPGK